MLVQSIVGTEMREVKSTSDRHGERKEIRNNSQRTCSGAGSSKIRNKKKCGTVKQLSYF